jgi:hypothetical protein
VMVRAWACSPAGTAAASQAAINPKLTRRFMPADAARTFSGNKPEALPRFIH